MVTRSHAPTVPRPPTPPPVPRPAIQRLAAFVHRHFLWLLLGCYAVAACWPRLGVQMRNWQLAGPLWGDVPLSLPLLLLALLLFCAAVVIEVGHVQTVLHRPVSLLVALLCVWLGPALLVVAVGTAFGASAPAGVLVGLALVATMPVANSSVGWSHNANGNLALSLGLIVFSILMSPWITPRMLQLLGLSLSESQRNYSDILVTQFSGKFFISWVILPTLLGIAARFLLGRSWVDRAGSGIALASAAALLLLNYVNAALAMPKLFAESQWYVLGYTVLLAVALSAIGMALAAMLARVLREPPEMRAALLFGLSMKHTGLALVLAGTVLHDQPTAILMIVVATVIQHVMAGGAQWWLEHTAG